MKNPTGIVRGLLATTITAVSALTVVAAPAQAADCLSGREVMPRQYIHYHGQEVGFGEVLWNPTTGQACAWFHVNSNFRANHSGWDVALANRAVQVGGSNLVRVPTNYVLTVSNSSAIDFATPPVSIDYLQPGHDTFAANFNWTYNDCSIKGVLSDLHDFNSGNNTPKGLPNDC